MKVTLSFGWRFCKVEREKTDPIFRDSGWATAESIFLYHVKKELIKQGYDVIKKRMYKDGHLVDYFQQYLRSRKIDKDSFFLYNKDYSIADLGKDFNERNKVYLELGYFFE